ncbi:archaemetzincin [Neomoorella humiferrea]|uniref:Peptidase family M54 n=1 Tax=Neomoorella humiferrea TaxID=676965 RepID=A0A2T0AJW6_9FIRM|nr:archaemetzincin [Moorella humiferrea]PRR68706.1 Peptidase family M54 [Moorella humiferrea]
MSINLYLYWQAELYPAAGVLGKQIEKVFFLIKSIPVAPLEPPAAGWDTFRGQYDVHFLLEALLAPQGKDLVLWLVSVDIGDPWHSYVFGAAGKQRAIVSTARIENLEDVCKEACHEVGHLLGLQHCRNNCCMRPSWTVRGIQNKPANLCEQCCNLLASLKGGADTD